MVERQPNYYVFDLEADGFLNRLSRIHSLCFDDGEKIHSLHHEMLNHGVTTLEDAAGIIGHNIISYDIPALDKVYGFKPKGEVIDTYVLSRLLFPNLFLKDYIAKRIPKELWGSHSLKAWGMRLREYKGDYTGGFDHWNPEMQKYCEQDVVVTKKLYEYLKTKEIPELASKIEHDFQKIIFQQEQNGVPFKVEEAEKLADIVEKELEDCGSRIRDRVPFHINRGELFTPKRNNKKLGYREGSTFNKLSVDEFNPGSRTQVIAYFKQRYKWEPTVFTDTGNPKLDDEVLRELPFEEADLFADYYERSKILGYLRTGKSAWTKLAERGRIHGKVNTMGADTFRCTHSGPNLGQVPSIRSYKGPECRSLFHSGAGWMVGADVSGLELRMLGHYMFPYDGGEYAHEVVEGDVHERNRISIGAKDRDTIKRFTYGWLYGAGDEKLGSILTGLKDPEKNTRIGKEARKKYVNSVRGLEQLLYDVKSRARHQGVLKLIDGRRCYTKSPHSALNYLLQGSGAILCKLATNLFWEKPFPETYQTLHVHDEWQTITNREDLISDIGNRLVSTMTGAGKILKLKVPITGEYKYGKTWKDTH